MSIEDICLVLDKSGLTYTVSYTTSVDVQYDRVPLRAVYTERGIWAEYITHTGQFEYERDIDFVKNIDGFAFERVPLDRGVVDVYKFWESQSSI